MGRDRENGGGAAPTISADLYRARSAVPRYYYGTPLAELQRVWLSAGS